MFNDSSCDSYADDGDDDSCAENITSRMFTMALVPTKSDLSDHSSDDEIYECSDSEDEYHDAEYEPRLECTCGLLVVND